jgi:hypothetical protein
MYNKIKRLSVLLAVSLFWLPMAPSNAKTDCQIIDFSTHGDGPFDTAFYKHNGITFTETSAGGFIVGFVQGDDALITDFGHQDGPISGTLIPPVSSLSMRVAPALQGTAEYTLTTFDPSGKLIVTDSVLVTQDDGDPQTGRFGYFSIEIENLPRKAKFFILENRFIRSSSPSNTFIPFGIGEVRFSKNEPTCPKG